MAKKNVPQVRFKGFTSGWVVKSLSDVVSVNSGRDYKHLEEGAVPVYGTGGYMLSVNDSLSKNIDGIGLGRKGTIDKPYILKAPFWTVDTLFYCLPQRNNDLHFTFALFQKIDWKQKNESTGVPSLSKVAITTSLVSLAETCEQQKLGLYLRNIDNLIAFHLRKHEKLLNVKKAMLEKMFPKDGEDVPSIRFKGFTDKWNLANLSDEVDFYSGLTYSPHNVVKEDGTLVLRSSNVQEGQISLTDNVFVRSDVVNSSNVIIGDIIVVVRNGSRNLIGKHAQIKKEMKNTVIGAFMTGIRPRQSSFINALLDTNLFSKEVEKNLGATINQITTGMFKKMQFLFPKIEEQKCIGLYFDILNELIVHQSEELEKLKNIKKALLEKMFI